MTLSPLAALLIDWVVTALWPLIGASGMRHYSGLLFSTAGLVVGLAVLAPFLAVRGRWRRVFDRDVAPSLAAMGFFSGLATAIYISALAYTTPANAAIVAQVEVLYSAVLCAWLLGERPSLKQGAATLLVLLGTGLIMFRDLSSPRWRGDLMILLTPWMYQVSHIFSKRLPKDLDAWTLSGGRVFFGLVTMAPLCLWSLWHGPRWSWEPRALGLVALQGVLMSSTNFVLWYLAIRRMDLTQATAIMLSYPALTLLFSWTFGHEHAHALQIVGMAVTMVGAIWTSRLVMQAQRARVEAGA
ncbi:MAG: DMT family transporter [Elusimicrobiota bacterium]|nr:DMT family transporter [Elusimicrobiota bacterium]